MTANKFYTIGHSTTPLVEFIDILRHAGVDHVVDVRKIPRSRGNPQYNTISMHCRFLCPISK